MRKGFFITFEGSEGSGKSTQARRLVAALRRHGHRVVFLRDPGSTALGRDTRQVLLHSKASVSPIAEALLFIGGRVALVEEKILPALKQGRGVVCDRFHDSTVVYQGYAGGLDVAWLDKLGRRAIGNVMPQLTFLLDISVKEGFSRLKRAHDRMERKARDFHRRVRAGFRDLARRQPRRIVLIDATQPPAKVEKQIRAAVFKRLESKLAGDR